MSPRKKGIAYACFKNQKELAPVYLKVTIWDGREYMIAFPNPTAKPIPFRVAAPTKTLTDPDCHCEMRRLGGEYKV